MFSSKFGSFLGGIVFLLISLVAGYRLLVPFPIEIAGIEVRGVATFLTFAIFAALSIVAFQGSRSGK